MEGLQHTARVSVQTREFWCEGDIILPRPGGYKGRINDVLNNSEQFVALTDVTVYRERDEEGDDPVTYQVLLIRKGAIEFVVPLD